MKPILEQISKLIDVKSIITLTLDFGLLYMVIVGIDVPSDYMTLCVTANAFYFGTQNIKNKKVEDTVIEKKSTIKK